MISEITNGIKVSVETFFQKEGDDDLQQQILFAYRITIENETEFPVKILARHWFIFDSIGVHKEVEGEGIVGKQPTIQPFEYHQYVSGCTLDSNIGSMKGYYKVQRISDGKLFKISIPEFILIHPAKLN